MAEEAPAAPPAKAPKKKATPKVKKDGPPLRKLITDIVTESSNRKGVSLSAIKKALKGKGYDVEKNKKRINLTIVKMVEAGVLSKPAGIGAAGSFKLAKSAPKPKKAVKAKKPAVKKPAAKKPAAKKPAAKKTAAKKPAAKKTAAKKAATKKVAVKKTTPKKSPKKAPKKTAVKKTPKKAVPKKTKAAKKTPTKKTAAKKAKK